MKFASVRHKGLRRFIEKDDAAGLPAAYVEKIRNILSFLQEMTGVEELKVPPNWGAHMLGGDRRGVWSLTVSRNWRLTFRLDEDGTITDLDLEDYH